MKSNQIMLESMVFPDPVIQVAIEPKTKAGQDKMTMALLQAGGRRPHLQDLHRSADRARPSSPAWASCIWKSSWTVCCASSRWKPPSASLRLPTSETIRKRGQGRRPLRPSDRRSRPVRSLLDRDHPVEPGEGYAFENKIVGGVIPKEFIAPIDAGIQRSCSERSSGGFEVVDFKATRVRRLLPRCRLL